MIKQTKDVYAVQYRKFEDYNGVNSLLDEKYFYANSETEAINLWLKWCDVERIRPLVVYRGIRNVDII